MFDEKSYNLKMDKAIEVFSKELSSLRTGRANASMLDLIKVDVYGQQMPINQIGVDAAIIFSDILVVLQAMNIEVEMREGIGPFLPNPIKDKESINQVILPDVHEHLGYVFDAVKLTKKELNNRVPLIGFAGAPWTLFCYALQGQGSKNFNIAKAFCYQHPELAKELLQKITTTTIAYLREKVKAGADVIQLFDSWGGLLSPKDYQVFSWFYSQQIIDALSSSVPVIIFGKGCWFALPEMGKSGASAIGIDWTCSARNARYLSGGQVTLQGNFDPSKLLLPISEIKLQVKQMINEFGKESYIVNLGHGILPNVPVDHAKAFVDAVKEYNS